MLGAEKLLHELQDSAGPGIRVVRAPCVGRCDTAPAAEVGHHFVDHATVSKVLAAAKSGDTHTHLPDYVGYDKYVAGGGYRLLDRLRSGELTKEDLLKSLDDASLRGLGGAGFPTGRKWRAVLGEPGPRLMAINGDEGEPGTFKDRFYLETDPHRCSCKRSGDSRPSPLCLPQASPGPAWAVFAFSFQVKHCFLPDAGCADSGTVASPL
jgi:formate dehydrogenase